jgi:hypothetical protein
VSLNWPLSVSAQISSFAAVNDRTLAYKFKYPSTVINGVVLQPVFSRRPEKYSSAAPLSVDARQRIVCELVDLPTAFTVSVTVGPLSKILKSRPSSDWKPKEVVDAVLIDRSTARTVDGQRVALNNIQRIQTKEIDGTAYWYYEHTLQGSPSVSNPGLKATFRHALSVSAVREGFDHKEAYIYTMNIACPESLWTDVVDAVSESIDSFRLIEPAEYFISPEKDPWLFF